MNDEIIVIESPYAGNVERNIQYARAALHDCLLRGEAPYASHLLYTQEGVLDDNEPDQRTLGIKAGLQFHRVADRVVFYIDLGYSKGMTNALSHCQKLGIAYEERTIPGWDK